VHGIITKGGSAPNVIPDLCEARFYVRAPRRSELDPVSARVTACARGAALAAGCRLKATRFEPSLDDAVHSPALDAVLARNLRALGVRGLAPRDPAPGSADIGNVSRRIPTAYVYCAVAPRGLDLHTAEFARRCGGAAARRGLMQAVRALALSGLDLLRDPALLRRARRELRRDLARHG